jgi:ABC-2 type transport system ATP-binding protein
MKMLTGYLSPSEGVAKIAGHDMASDRIAGSQHLGYLPENGPLYPDMTPHSLLAFFADARGMDGARKEERINAVVDRCELGSVLHEPEVLILDEPTAGLDPNQIREMRQTLRRLGEEKTILLSTHILQEVEAMASRVILISEGRMVYDGPVAGMDTDGRGLDNAFHRLTGHRLA